MIKLLIGGSPCTYWSIAKTKNRETEASGAGWELFKNFGYSTNDVVSYKNGNYEQKFTNVVLR